ncbi:unnamed protein product [Protopolystoma xenopodis]|uniref:Uncharacterized protein n=1 Tax=Protopolystoma xenopodis TaxID=117903 RepID=A0A3S4ZVA5_9PLAT|nr:unnamed protein product [Protopolystoma xenopodis]
MSLSELLNSSSTIEPNPTNLTAACLDSGSSPDKCQDHPFKSPELTCRDLSNAVSPSNSGSLQDAPVFSASSLLNYSFIETVEFARLSYSIQCFISHRLHRAAAPLIVLVTRDADELLPGNTQDRPPNTAESVRANLSLNIGPLTWYIPERFAIIVVGIVSEMCHRQYRVTTYQALHLLSIPLHITLPPEHAILGSRFLQYRLSLCLKVGLLRRNHLHHRYQVLFADLIFI